MRFFTSFRMTNMASPSLRHSLPGERVGHSSPQQSWGVFWNILIKEHFTLLRRKPRVFRPWMNAGRVPFEAPKERSRVCFGGFRLLARSRFGEGRPDEACGGATGFSPWGSTFSLWVGATSAYLREAASAKAGRPDFGRLKPPLPQTNAPKTSFITFTKLNNYCEL